MTSISARKGKRFRRARRRAPLTPAEQPRVKRWFDAENLTRRYHRDRMVSND